MLSGGQRQAIAIARSVHSGARILLLDEPLAAMGAKEGEMILDLVRDLKEKGHSMIVVAHNYVHVLEVCDRVNLLQHGRITLDRLSSETSAEELTARGPGVPSAARRSAAVEWRDPGVMARETRAALGAPWSAEATREEGREEGPEVGIS